MSKPLVVITGASAGIGEAVAKLFNKAGHPLLLLARRIEVLEGLKLDNCICKKVDVTQLDQMEAAVKEAEEKFGPCELLVNNAGVMYLGEVDDQDPKQWQTMVDVNIIGVINGYRCVVKGMKERKHGTVINISSIAGHKTFENHSVYCGTKFAVQGFTETWRAECSSFGVRVAIVSPGVVATELLDVNPKDVVVEYKKALAHKIYPEDVAAAVDYIFSAPANVCIREVVIGPTGQTA